MAIFLIAFGLLATACYLLAWWVRSQPRYSAFKKIIVGNIIGGIFSLALFSFLDTLLHSMRGISFLDLLSKGSMIPIIVFAGGFVEGIIYEYVGQFGAEAWYYPGMRLGVIWEKIFLLALPIFWGIFMLIMQDAYAIARSLGASIAWSIILIAVIPFILIEGIDIFTKSWVYASWAKVHILIFGWVLLALTFVIGFNHFILNPFGF